MKESKEITESIYKRFGTDSGILFGIKDRTVVEMLVNMVHEECQTVPAGTYTEGDMVAFANYCRGDLTRDISSKTLLVDYKNSKP